MQELRLHPVAAAESWGGGWRGLMVIWSQDKHIGLWEATGAAGVNPVGKE